MEHLTYDVVVAGLGAMGSSALAHCALRGLRVLGVDQYGPVHDRGASSGKTRIIRQAYYEDPAYVPMLLRAYELWRDLELRSGEEILHLTGLLMAGKENSEIVSGSARAAKLHDLPVEHLDAAQMRSRYPQLLVRDDEVGIFERNGGAIVPERAIHAHLEVARRHGAEMRFHMPMREWSAGADGVSVKLGDGTCVEAGALVLTLGPWFADTLRELGVALDVQRNVQCWFSAATDAYAAASFPAFLIEREELPAPLYGFPDFGDGVKAALHGYGPLTDPGALDREVDAKLDIEPVARALESWMPGAASRFLEGKVCMYALTPDRHFVIDRHPAHERVVLCGGFSGHGFKFAGVVGEIAAQLALGEQSSADSGFLSLRRFAR